MRVLTPVKTIRANCLDCSGTAKAVAYCTCHGADGSRCESWPWRFGCRPETARVEFGEAMLDPKLMPKSDVELESLPTNPREYQSTRASA